MRIFAVALIPVFIFAQAPFAEKERVLGKHVAEDMHQRRGAVSDPEITAYVARIGGNIASLLGASFSFGVVREGSLEPAALPGGYVLVSLPLLNALRSEDELAGVLAHAMVHVWERHTLVGSAGNHNVPHVFMGGWAGENHVTMPARFAAKARDFELRADRRGMELAAQAGYQPQALAAFIERASPDQILSRSDRLSAIGGPAATAAPMENADFNRMRERVSSLLAIPEDRPPTLRRPGER